MLSAARLFAAAVAAYEAAIDRNPTYAYAYANTYTYSVSNTYSRPKSNSRS